MNASSPAKKICCISGVTAGKIWNSLPSRPLVSAAISLTIQLKPTTLPWNWGAPVLREKRLTHRFVL